MTHFRPEMCHAFLCKTTTVIHFSPEMCHAFLCKTTTHASLFKGTTFLARGLVRACEMLVRAL